MTFDSCITDYLIIVGSLASDSFNRYGTTLSMFYKRHPISDTI